MSRFLQHSLLLKRLKPGAVLSASDYQVLVDAARAFTGSTGAAAIYDRTGAHQRSVHSGGDVEVRRFRFVSSQNDYVIAQQWEGTDENGDDVWGKQERVAKPWKLRRTPFHGQTINGITYSYTGIDQRTATRGSDEETQVIVPAYYAGGDYHDELRCIKGQIGGTGVEVNDEDVLWSDLNVDGRAWAQESSA